VASSPPEGGGGLVVPKKLILNWTPILKNSEMGRVAHVPDRTLGHHSRRDSRQLAPDVVYLTRLGNSVVAPGTTLTPHSHSRHPWSRLLVPDTIYLLHPWSRSVTLAHLGRCSRRGSRLGLPRQLLHALLYLLHPCSRASLYLTHPCVRNSLHPCRSPVRHPCGSPVRHLCRSQHSLHESGCAKNQSKSLNQIHLLLKY
jgi:hypothetical protein